MDWNVLTGASSSVVALAALGFSVVTFRRQQARAERDARANVTPLVDPEPELRRPQVYSFDELRDWSRGYSKGHI